MKLNVHAQRTLILLDKICQERLRKLAKRDKGDAAERRGMILPVARRVPPHIPKYDNPQCLPEHARERSHSPPMSKDTTCSSSIAGGVQTNYCRSCSEVNSLPFLDKPTLSATLMCNPIDSLPKVLLPMTV